MEAEMIIVRYSDTELDEFKKIIEEKKTQAEKDLKYLKESYRNGSGNDDDDTSPRNRDNEGGRDHLDKETYVALALRQEKFIRDLNNALSRIENKTYGIDHKTGKRIGKERLRRVPHATTDIDQKIAENKKKGIYV